MYGSFIYNDFKEDLYWIRDQIQGEVPFFPDSIKPLLNHYIKKRLIIIPSNEKTYARTFDYELGRPVPYATFWFAHAFGLKDKTVIRRLGLGLIYSSLSTTIRDDIIDGEGPPNPERTQLLHYYNNKYLEIFNDLFPPESPFWFHLSKGILETSRYEHWNLFFDSNLNVNPFSEQFLSESSRYFTAVVMPTLVALAILTENAEGIEVVYKFLQNFSMGWRIYDDLCDWRKDLTKAQLNHNSILLYTKQKIQEFTELNENSVGLMFVDRDFISDSYGAILGFFEKAQKDVSKLNNKYLDKFMEEQISFHTKRRDIIYQKADELNSRFFEQLKNILTKNSNVSLELDL